MEGLYYLIMFTYIKIDERKRLTGFPYPVEIIGQIRLPQTDPVTYDSTKLEVCLRLSGEDDYAADRIDGHDFQTPYPHVIYKLPGHRHYYHAKDYREAVFFIYSEETTRRLAALGFLPEQMLLPITLTGELKHLIRRLISLMAVSETLGSADKIDLVCFAILEELLFQRNVKSDDIQGRIRKIASLLQMDAENKPDIAGIAAANGFSERSFYRHWKKVFAVSPAQYVVEQKMKRACWLLTRSRMRIGDIASMLRFCDDNSFSSAFKHYYGMTPREYRKKAAAPLM